MTHKIPKLLHELVDPAYWAALYRSVRSWDVHGLRLQLQAFYLRQQKRKTVLQVNPARFAPEPTQWPDDQPLISVIVTCYNEGRFVQDAVDSILAQHYQDFEIILIDGGSTDGSAQTLAGISHSKIRTFLREGKHLLGDNRNFGIKQARGKYVCCIDADDKITPDFLMKLAFLLEATNLDVVGTAKTFFGMIERTYHGVAQPTLSDLRIGNPISIASLYPKLLWEQTGPFTDFGTGDDYIFEDWEFWYRAALHGARFYRANGEPLFLHRVHNTSTRHHLHIKPRKSHAHFINKRHAAATDRRIVDYSRLQRHTVYARTNPLINLIRHPRPGLFRHMHVTDKPDRHSQSDRSVLTVSLAQDDTTTLYCPPRFLPALLYAGFIQFVQLYFALDPIQVPKPIVK